MMIIDGLHNMRDAYRAYARRSLERHRQSRLINRNITIFSSNCVGGVIYHDLGLRFNSPTINKLFKPDDYLKFLADVKRYLQEDLYEIQTNKTYPCGLLDDVRIDFVHYPSFSSAKMAWEKRKQRVDLSNCCVIMVDGGDCTDGQVEAFNDLPYEYKAFLTWNRAYDTPCSVVCPDWQNATKGNLVAFKNPLSIERWIDEWDYVSFINQVG